MKKISAFVAAAAIVAGAVQLNADTTWLIQPVATSSKSMQLFTSRSSGKPRPLLLQYVPAAGKKTFGHLRCGNDSKFAYAGINERGLVVAFSGADPTRDRPNKPKGKQFLYGGNFIVAHLLTNCGNVRQAEDRLRKLARSGYIAGSMIVFLADAKNAMVFEIAPRHYATARLGLHYTVYANRWKISGMEDASMRKPWELLGNLQEEWAVKEAILRARHGITGKLTVPASFAISRLNAADIKVKGINRGPCSRSTVDAYLFEISPVHPEILSCVYASFGPPRHTVYLPIPLCAIDSLPPEVANAEWSGIGVAMAKRIPDKTPVSEELPEFEKYLLQEFNDARRQAEAMLKENKTEEAKALLRDTLRRQAGETLKFMRERK